PRLVSRIEDVHGIPEWSSRPEAVGRVVSPEVARAVVDTMVRVTAPGGPAPLGRVPGIDVAGKTGTAQKAAPGGYGDQHVSSFIALAPAERPSLAVAVIVDSPSRGRNSGASVAAPVASHILAEGLRHTGGIDTDVRVATLPDAPLTAPDGMEAATIPGTSVRIAPDLRDKTLRDAVVALQDAQLDWTVRGSGRVVHQIPEPGTALVGGDPITLVLQ
ncbi:MAG: penicillin-binding transpeptidase domain-containing protein, partial [Myxococcota bacterium]